MESAAVTPEQLDRLLHGIARGRDYTRMNSLGFPNTDSVKAASGRAGDAIEALYQMTAELERAGGTPLALISICARRNVVVGAGGARARGRGSGGRDY